MLSCVRFRSEQIWRSVECTSSNLMNRNHVVDFIFRVNSDRKYLVRKHVQRNHCNPECQGFEPNNSKPIQTARTTNTNANLNSCRTCSINQQHFNNVSTPQLQHATHQKKAVDRLKKLYHLLNQSVTRKKLDQSTAATAIF